VRCPLRSRTRQATTVSTDMVRREEIPDEAWQQIGPLLLVPSRVAGKRRLTFAQPRRVLDGGDRKKRT
jgi:hypothetical protein